MQGFVGSLYLFGAFFLAGTSVIAAHSVTGLLKPFTITCISLFFAWLGLLPFSSARRGIGLSQMTASDKRQLFFQALFGIFLFRLFLLQGLVQTSAGEAGILTGATPAVTALLAWIVLKERLNPLRLIGIISTAIGVMALQGLLTQGASFRGEHWVGNLMVLSAASCESFFNVLSRISSIRVSRQEAPEISPVDRTFWVVTVAMVLCLVPALFENPIPAVTSLNLWGWAALLWYGLIVTALAFVFWYEGIRRCDASMAAAFSGMMPFTALILSVLILGENPGYEGWIGGVFVGAGMVLTGIRRKTPSHGYQTPKENTPLDLANTGLE